MVGFGEWAACLLGIFHLYRFHPTVHTRQVGADPRMPGRLGVKQERRMKAAQQAFQRMEGLKAKPIQGVWLIKD